MSNNALILCGGQGTRFKMISSRPKILAPFRGEAFITWLVNYVKKNEIKLITFSLGYGADEICEFVQNNNNFKNIDLNFCREEMPLGTGGAIQHFFHNYEVADTVVLNGDTYWPNLIPKNFLLKRIDLASCLTTKISINDRYGDFNVNSGKLHVSRGSEAQPISDSVAFTGICRISRNICFSGLEPPFSFEELLCHQKNGIDLYTENFPFYDYGTPVGFQNLMKYDDC